VNQKTEEEKDDLIRTEEKICALKISKLTKNLQELSLPASRPPAGKPAFQSQDTLSETPGIPPTTKLVKTREEIARQIGGTYARQQWTENLFVA